MNDLRMVVRAGHANDCPIPREQKDTAAHFRRFSGRMIERTWGIALFQAGGSDQWEDERMYEAGTWKNKTSSILIGCFAPDAHKLLTRY